MTYVRGGSSPVAVMRAADAEPVLADLFPKALLQTGHPGSTRVVIERAGATLGTANLARQVLVRAGMGVVVGQASTSTASTAVYIPEDSELARQLGAEAAKALGLPATLVRVDPGPNPIVDVRIVLGSDFAPV